MDIISIICCKNYNYLLLIDIIRFTYWYNSFIIIFVPRSMKYAYITSILKKHNSSKLSNYRTVSQLTSIYKTGTNSFVSAY